MSVTISCGVQFHQFNWILIMAKWGGLELRRALAVCQDVGSPLLLRPPIINSNSTTERHAGVEHWPLRMKPLEVSHHKTEESRIMRSVCSRGLSYIFHRNAGFVQNCLNLLRSWSMGNKQLGYILNNSGIRDEVSEKRRIDLRMKVPENNV